MSPEPPPQGSDPFQDHAATRLVTRAKSKLDLGNQVKYNELVCPWVEVVKVLIALCSTQSYELVLKECNVYFFHLQATTIRVDDGTLS